MADDSIPPRVINNLNEFHDKITNMEEVLRPVLATTLEKCHENMTPLEKAKLDLVSLYAANSLFWIYLSTKGLDPKDYPVIHELDRVKKYMEKIKEIEDRAKAPKVNKESAKRFVRNALFDPETCDKRNEPVLVIIEPSSSVTKSDKEVGQLKSIAKKSEMTTKEESKKRKFEDIAAKKGKKKQR